MWANRLFKGIFNEKLHVLIIVEVSIKDIFLKRPLREKCPYSEFFWPVFSRIPAEYGEVILISPC